MHEELHALLQTYNALGEDTPVTCAQLTETIFWNAVTLDASLSLIYTSRASDVRYIQLIG